MTRSRGSTPSGNLVRRVMRNERASIARLAETLEVHPKTVRRWLSGESTPDFSRLQELMTLAPGARCPCCEHQAEETA